MKSKISLTLIGLLLITSCSEIYDLRPEDYAKRKATKSSKSRAHEIVEQCFINHGWGNTKGKIKVTYVDSWPNLLFKIFFNPWPSARQEMDHYFFVNRLYHSQIKLLNGVKKGETWGIVEKDTPYIIKTNGSIIESNSKDIPFYLPTYQYFIQLPYWIKDIPFLDYMGEIEFNGKSYYQIFGSWNQGEPSMEFDQYIFWIHKENYQLECVQYTIRAQFGSAHGTNTFSNFKSFGNLIIPTTQSITFNRGETNTLHQLDIIDVQIVN